MSDLSELWALIAMGIALIGLFIALTALGAKRTYKPDFHAYRDYDQAIRLGSAMFWLSVWWPVALVVGIIWLVWKIANLSYRWLDWTFSEWVS